MLVVAVVPSRTGAGRSDRTSPYARSEPSPNSAAAPASMTTSGGRRRGAAGTSVSTEPGSDGVDISGRAPGGGGVTGIPVDGVNVGSGGTPKPIGPESRMFAFGGGKSDGGMWKFGSLMRPAALVIDAVRSADTRARLGA